MIFATSSKLNHTKLTKPLFTSGISHCLPPAARLFLTGPASSWGVHHPDMTSPRRQAPAGPHRAWDDLIVISSLNGTLWLFKCNQSTNINQSPGT